MKIGILLYKNIIGGAETVSLVVADLLKKQGHKVFFIFPGGLEKDTGTMFIPNDYSVYNNTYYSNLEKRITVKNILTFFQETINKENPDIIISMFLEESNILLKIKNKVNNNFKLIMMDHAGTCAKRKVFWQKRLISTYEQADAIVTVSKIDELFFKENIKKNIKIITIQNLPQKQFFNEINFNKKSNKILTLGRLSKTKGFDILINSFNKISNKGDWSLSIYGDGIEKDNLQKQITALKLENKVTLYPAVKNVAEIMNEHDIFILPSLVESYGMVLVEALLMGMPCISFDCPNGPAIIESELPGCIDLVEINNEYKLTNAIIKLMENEKKRKDMSLLAIKYRKIINEEKISILWKNLINEV